MFLQKVEVMWTRGEECSSPTCFVSGDLFLPINANSFLVFLLLVCVCVCVCCCTRVSLFTAYNLLFNVQKCVHCLKV